MADRTFARLLADVLSFGWVLPASIAAGAGFGWLLDRFLGTGPVLMALFALFGFAAGVWQLWREMEIVSGRGDDGPGRGDGGG